MIIQNVAAGKWRWVTNVRDAVPFVQVESIPSSNAEAETPSSAARCRRVGFPSKVEQPREIWRSPQMSQLSVPSGRIDSGTSIGSTHNVPLPLSLFQFSNFVDTSATKMVKFVKSGAILLLAHCARNMATILPKVIVLTRNSKPCAVTLVRV